MLYFDNAATTQMDVNVIEHMVNIMQTDYGNPSSLYKYGIRANKLVETAREVIATDIHALPEEILFTSGGTESDNAVMNLALLYGCPGKTNIAVSAIEHHAILEPAYFLEQKGFEVRYLKVEKDGIISMEDLKRKIDKNTLLVSIMLVNNEIGTIQPIKEIVETVHAINSKTLIHTDAVQAVGHIHIDVGLLDVNYLSASAHKFNGPKGTGILYVKKGFVSPTFMLGGGQEKGRRSGTENVAAISGMSVALHNNVLSIVQNENKIKLLQQIFYDRLDYAGIEYRINGSVSKRMTGNINISINNIDGEGMLHVLDLHNICISTGSACNSKKKEPSHVLTAIGCNETEIEEAVRITIGKYNTKEEVNALADAIINYCNLIK